LSAIKSITTMKTPLKSLFLAALLPLAGLAVPYDLTTAGSSATVNGALFQTTTLQTTGTGVIEPFLRLQGTGTESGLNSDSANANLYADTKFGAWTHDVKLADLGVQNGFVGFLLDINQTSANPTLLFDSFKVYSRAGSITDGTQDLLSDVPGVLRYDLGANSLLLNYDLNPGSGAGDLLILLPTSFFTGATLADQLYVVAGFSGSNDGFEEFSTFGVDRPTPGQFDFPSVPDNANTLILMGAGMIGLVVASRKRTAHAV
jgi:hypothetical protein